MGSLSAEQFFGPLSMGALSDGCRERQRGARTLRLTERRDGEALVAARTVPGYRRLRCSNFFQEIGVTIEHPQ